MQKIKITCDSTSDLGKDLYIQRNITAVPLGISLGDDFCRDGVDVDADQLFAFVERTGELPKTSAISVGEYEEVFGKYVQDGYTVIHINISSEFSSCYQNACIAAEEVGNVFVVDSRNLSTGSGYLVLMAQDLADEGMAPQEIVDTLNAQKDKMDASFVLQTLEYLHKGGRCSGVAAFGANLMKLRPEIEVMGGKMQVGKKYRGTIEKSILAYIRGRLEGREDVDCRRIFVTHSGVPEEILEKAVDLVRQLHPFQEVILTRAGCTISSHCGPECFGVLFMKK